MFSSELKEFMKSHIQSVWQLELLLFFKNHEEGASIVDVCSANYLDEVMAERAVRGLVEANLLAETGDCFYRYMPARETSKLIDELARAYANRRATVIELIYSSYV